MNKEYIPVNEPLLDGNEENYLVECIRSGWISCKVSITKIIKNLRVSGIKYKKS